MQQRSFLVGVGVGFSAGYVLYRTCGAFAELRAPSTRRAGDAAGYGRARRAFAVAGIARSVAGMAAFSYGAGSRRVARATQTPWPWLDAGTFAVAAFGVATLAELPIDYVEGYALERQHGLSEQSPRAWLAERAKESVLSLAISGLLAGLFSTIVRRFRASWPFAAGAGVLPLAVLANLIVPLYILPLFNRFEPLTGPLEIRLRSIAERYGVGDAAVLRVDMSRQTKKANAFVTGLGHTHRIVLGDTLLEHFTDDEIAFVVAHELGHYVSKDTWRMIAASTAFTTIVLFAASLLTGKETRDRPNDPVTVSRILFWFTLLSQFGRPALAAFSRSREWAADRFAESATCAPLDGVAAFRRLRDQNLAEDEQPAWYEFLFSTHPSLGARIAALEGGGTRT